jgi:hypothetical protein
MPINLNFSTDSVLALKAQLDELRKSIAKATDVDEISQLNKQFEITGAKLRDVNKAIGDVKSSNLGASFEDIYGDIKPLNAQLGEMEDRMYQLAFAGKANTDEFIALRNETVRIRQTVMAVDESVDDLAANRGIASFGSQLGGIGSSLASLDFSRANEQATTLANAAKKINFGTAIKSVKDLGSTFMTLGKALLTNPLFLIAAAIVILVVIIVKLMDKLGLMNVMMDAVGKVMKIVEDAIDAIIQPLKDLTDWLGWTANAATDSAEKQSIASKKAADAAEYSNERQTIGLDRRIQLLKAEGKDTTILERQKVVLLANTANARALEAKAAYDAAKLKGELDAAELKDLYLKYQTVRDGAQDANANIKQFDALAAIDKKKSNDAEQKTNSDNAKKSADTRTAANDKRKATEATEAANRLAANRLIIDLEIDAMEDGIEKELAINRVKYERLRLDLLTNEKYSLDEKAKLKVIYDAQEIVNAQLLAKKESDIKIAASNEYYDYLDTLVTGEVEKATLARSKQFDDEITQLDTFLANKQITQDEYDKLAKDALVKTQADINKIIADNALIEKTKQDEDYLLGLQNNATSLGDTLNLLNEEKRIKLENTNLTENERAAIIAEYEQKTANAKMAAVQKGTESAAAGLNAVQGLSDSLFASKMSGLKKGSAEELAAAKKQFEVNKKLQIAQALIQGVQGVMAAFSSGSAIPVVGAVTGPLFAGMAGIAALANINKIKNSTFSGGGSVAASSGGGSPSIPSGATATATPRLSLTGQASDRNNLTSTNSAESNPTINVVATVSETEITSTQSRVARYAKNAEL